MASFAGSVKGSLEVAPARQWAEQSGVGVACGLMLNMAAAL